MTKEEIVAMAREADIGFVTISALEFKTGSLSRFAALVAAAEREACAKVCEAQVETGAHLRCAAAIRARSQS